MSRAFTIEEDNLSVGWAKALLHVVEGGEISPLTVVIRGFTDGQPMEVTPVRRLLDDALGTDAKGSPVMRSPTPSSPVRSGTRRPTANSSTSATAGSCPGC